MKKSREIIIVGAGPGGLFTGIYFAQKGFKVTLVEERSDSRFETQASGRSVNLSLPKRAVLALQVAGIWDLVEKFAVSLDGRVIHHRNGTESYQPYGCTSQEIEYSIKRNDLLSVLISHADTIDNIDIFFKTKCIQLDLEAAAIRVQNVDSHQTFTLEADFIIGADGIHSQVREKIFEHKKTASFHKETLKWGYKEFSIPVQNSLSLANNKLHVWSAHSTIMFVFPNLNQSFSCTFILPLEGQESFSSIVTKEQVEELFSMHFPEIFALVPNLTTRFLETKTGKFVCTYADEWYYKDKAVLLGDACHAVMPFYSQGVSIALEDCLYLYEAIEQTPNCLQQAFSTFQMNRKNDTDVLTELSKKRFFELKDKVSTPFYSARQQAQLWLEKKIPTNYYKRLYSLIVHTNLPYSKALKQYNRQERIVRFLGIEFVIFFLIIYQKIKIKITADDTLSPIIDEVRQK